MKVDVLAKSVAAGLLPSLEGVYDIYLSKKV